MPCDCSYRLPARSSASARSAGSVDSLATRSYSPADCATARRPGDRRMQSASWPPSAVRARDKCWRNAFEHVGRRLPVLQADQCRAGIVFGTRPDLRGRRTLLDAQEVIGRRAEIARLVGLLALLVDRSRQILDERGARIIACRCCIEHVCVRRLRRCGILRELERRVRDRRVHAVRWSCAARASGYCSSSLRAELAREREILHLEEVLRGGDQHCGRVLVLGEPVRELQRAGHGVARAASFASALTSFRYSR